ncbi:MAG: hypothetical protein ACYC1U_02660 [Candidatus Aquicultorales bacterium]
MALFSAISSRVSEITGIPRYIRIALLSALLLASALIIAVARGDLWLDEIWSLSIARSSRSVIDVLRFKHDNNHPLNTIYLYYVLKSNSFFIYRLFAVLSGISSVLLIGYIARKHWGYREALVGIVLAGSSYPLLLYFSEARGYAPAIFFALASYALLHENLQRPRVGMLLLFWTASILGMLSHATFIMAAIAFCVISCAHEIQAAGSFRHKSLRFLAPHAIPLTFFAIWYLFFLRSMEIGGGDIHPTWNVLAQLSALLIGFPEVPGFLGVAVVLILVLITVGVISLRQEGDAQWLFFLTILIISPATFLLLARPAVLQLRYFSVSFPFFYLLLSYAACKWHRLLQNRWRWIAVVAVITMIAGQTPRIYALVTLGRGSYSTALAQLGDRSQNGVVRIGSDHDFRNRLLFDFYAPLVSGGQTLRYVEQQKWGETPPDVLLIHSQDISYKPPDGLNVKGIGTYRLANEYRFSGISGWSWFAFY